MSEYFALSEKDIEFDNTIRESVKKSKSKSHMALYLQGQEELNLLRELVQRQRDMSEDLSMLHDVMKHFHELTEKEDHCISTDEAYLQIIDELDSISCSLNGLIEYIFDNEEDELETLTSAQKMIVKDASSLIRLHAARAAKNYSKTLSEEDKHMLKLWDYILCTLEFVKGLYD